MKRLSLTVMMVVALLMATVTPALAGGDKVRGENGQGSVTQVQVQDPPPFQPQGSIGHFHLLFTTTGSELS